MRSVSSFIILRVAVEWGVARLENNIAAPLLGRLEANSGCCHPTGRAWWGRPISSVLPRFNDLLVLIHFLGKLDPSWLL